MAFSSPPPASDGAVALIGTGASAIGMLWRLRAAGVSVRWFSGHLDVAEEALLASAPPGALELVFADPREAEFGDDVAAVVSAAGSPTDELVAGRARDCNVAVNVVGRPDLSTFQILTALEQHAAPAPQQTGLPIAPFLGHTR